MQCSATASEQDTIINDCPEDPNHLESARVSDEVRADATTCEKAGDGIRTHDVQLGKLATRFASADESSACKRDNPNPSSIPSSQAQQARIVDPFLPAIEQALSVLSDVDRNAVVQHIKKLAKMSKKRRRAILTLTEEEA